MNESEEVENSLSSESSHIICTKTRETSSLHQSGAILQKRTKKVTQHFEKKISKQHKQIEETKVVVSSTTVKTDELNKLIK